MDLTLEYDDDGCSGTFHYREPLLLPAAVNTALVAACVAPGLALVVVAGLEAAEVILVFLGMVGGAVVVALENMGVIPLERRRRARFRARGGWLTVERSGQADRMFLPRSRVVRDGAILEVTSRLTGDRVAVEAGPGGEQETLLHEVEGILRQMQRMDLGMSTDVPDQIQRLTGAVRTPEA